MTFADRIKDDFEVRDWSRGLDYYRSGAVKLRRQDSVSVDAAVQGTSPQPYAVHLDWSEANYATLLVHCTCPRFAETECCKHVAATIIAASEAGLKVPGKRPLRLEALDLDRRRDDEDEDEEDDVDLDARRVLPSRPPFAQPPDVPLPDVHAAGRPTVGSHWKQRVTEWEHRYATTDQARLARGVETKPRQIWYVLDLLRTRARGLPTISLYQRVLKKDGTLGKLKVTRLSRDEVDELTVEEDRALLSILVGGEFAEDYVYDDDGYNSGNAYPDLSTCSIAPAMFEILLPRLCSSGRFGWLPQDSPSEQFQPLAWDDGPPWTAKIRAANNAAQQQWEITAELTRGTETLDISSAMLLLAHGLVIFPTHLARFDPGQDFRWPAMLRQGPLVVPVKQEQEFLESVAVRLPPPADAEWPDELQWSEVQARPQPQLKVARSKRAWQSDLECRVSFQYGDKVVSFGDELPAWYDRQTRSLLRRDVAFETAACDQLLAAGVQARAYYQHDHATPFFLSPRKLPHVVTQLAAAGWQIEAEGQRIRQAGAFSINVHSSVDWFDLEGTCDFGGVTAGLPELLAALERGDQYIVLSDGSQGILPEQWLARYAPLAGLGELSDERLRFRPTQAALLDALLAAQDQTSIHVDQAFARLRDRLHSFEGIQPRDEPRSFVGELRPYQRDGLGWLKFLDDFAFGGCLADDMGLGKTIQVLAWLDARRASRAGEKPANGKLKTKAGQPSTSLVVAPRSLIFNWIEEARRFTPQLRVLNYTGLDRAAGLKQLHDFDLVVTTYGTIRRDIAKLREIEFDYAILDEAQAIKNATSQASKACRLLRAHRRLAMTGTPVENHLGELWALFEFLNPGMLGRNSKLHNLLTPGRRSRIALAAPDADAEQQASLTILSKALRPFMLRRTKEQVLTELPPKTEQTLYCELDRPERKQYDELREHYRHALLERVQKVGIKKSKVHVLEALLRLRQAACHPGLLDEKKVNSSSSKIETLLEQLEEVIAGGHKALVFSQFTSLLAIVRHQLEQRKMVYEYLDGKTIKRQAKVERFQTDPACPLFLISLKAGGLGLNLTAADYIFILDPWWNPAVEAQAVDRAHRMGQDRHVFAYRLIARDTIEEKILKLQEHKRGLADAIISAEGSLLQSLTAEDLQILLS